jgi:hypothetical protein
MSGEYPGRLRGWRFVLLNVATGLANVVVLSNVPGYTIQKTEIARFPLPSNGY